jgi:hypothetical protein
MSLPNRSSIVTFDGQNKINDQNQPPANQPLNWDNPSLGRCVSDVAALGLVSPRVWLRMTLSTSTGGLVLVSNWSVWSNATSTLPVLGRTTTGVFTVTLPTEVSDEYDASFNTTNNIAVNLSAARGGLESSSVFGFVNASATGNVITIYTADKTGTPNDLNGVTLFLVAY